MDQALNQQKSEAKKSRQGLDPKLRLFDARRDVIGALVAESALNDELAEGWQERDSPSEDQLRELAHGRRDSLHHRLRQIDEALERIGEGVYGACAGCGREIDKKRLALDPTIELCIRCQSAEEPKTATPSL